MKFEETYLNDNILDALYDMHFEDMTPIQERCIPEILDGYDVLGVAQTGTGKTAAYLLPIWEWLRRAQERQLLISCLSSPNSTMVAIPKMPLTASSCHPPVN